MINWLICLFKGHDWVYTPKMFWDEEYWKCKRCGKTTSLDV